MEHQVLYSKAGIATQILVNDDQYFLLFDIGDGIIRDLLSVNVKFPIDRPIHIFITHGHFDHCGGLFSFLGFLRMINQNQHVMIYSPERCFEVESLLSSFLKIYSETISFKIEHQTLVTGDNVSIDRSTSVRAYKMQHAGSIVGKGKLNDIPALGYAIFSANKKLLSYTGDTGLTEEVKELIQGSNHAYIEITNLPGNYNAYHLTPEEANQLGKLAKSYSLIHSRYESR